MVSKVTSLCIVRVPYSHRPVCHLHLLEMPSRENTGSIFENNMIWSNSTSSMTQSFSESISSDCGGLRMVCFVALNLLPFERSPFFLIRLIIPLGWPTPSFGILGARTLRCHVDP